MRLTCRADATLADGAGAPSYMARKKMALADFTQMLALLGQRIDRDEPFQDRDASGLLWLDAQGATKTKAEVTAAIDAAVASGVKPPAFRPKHRPRTQDEAWAYVTARFFNSLSKLAQREYSDQQEISRPNPPPLPVSDDA